MWPNMGHCDAQLCENLLTDHTVEGVLIIDAGGNKATCGVFWNS